MLTEQEWQHAHEQNLIFHSPLTNVQLQELSDDEALAIINIPRVTRKLEKLGIETNYQKYLLGVSIEQENK